MAGFLCPYATAKDLSALTEKHNPKSIMREKIDCFLTCDKMEDMAPTINMLRNEKAVQHIHLITTEQTARMHRAPEGCTLIVADAPTSSNTKAATPPLRSMSGSTKMATQPRAR